MATQNTHPPMGVDMQLEVLATADHALLNQADRRWPVSLPGSREVAGFPGAALA